MEESGETGGGRPFGRTVDLIKSHTLQEFFGIASLFAVAYTIKSIGDIYFSDLIAWSLTLLPIALLTLIYNMAMQARNRNVKLALVLDWLDLPIDIHIKVILGCAAASFFAKLLTPTSVPAGHYNNFQPLKNENIPAAKGIAYE